MQTHNIVQGDANWRAYRRTHRNASDAPAMMGASPYKTRTELLHECHTGIAREIDAATQARFDDGHRFEAWARELGEEIVGETLYPVVGSLGKYSASFDGLTMDELTSFEHKTLNDDIRAATCAFDLPEYLRIQMEHQLMVADAERCLFMASKWDGNGELIEEVHHWYEPDAELRARIVAGWDQFERDLAAYAPVEVIDKPIGRTPETLPALRIEVTGQVTASNLADFKAHALGVFAGINRTLTTDQEFATAKATVKWCGEVETRLEAAKQHALSQTESIDALFKTIDDISAESKKVRLELDKLVTKREGEVKTEIVTKARTAYEQHISELKESTAGAWIVLPAPDFAAAIKGKRNIALMQDAVDTLLANSKVAADASARAIVANLDRIKGGGAGFEFLFADKLALIGKAPDDLNLLIKSRIADHAAAEAKKAEELRAKIQAEEQSKAQAEVMAKINAEAAARKEEEERALAAEVARRQQTEMLARAAEIPSASAPKAAPNLAEKMFEAMGVRVVDVTPPAPIDTGAKIKLGEICNRLGFTVTADFLAARGFPQVGREGAAKLYRACDWQAICASIVSHVQGVAAEGMRQAA